MDIYKISVIIPIYNSQKYIERAMQSLLNQTIGFNNLQVIFVDDCSTDKSWDIICGYDDKYKNVFAYRLSENSGSEGQPRNKGLEFVKSKYVMFLDSDDMYCDDTCKVLYDEMESNDVDFVSGFILNFQQGLSAKFSKDKVCVNMPEKIFDLYEQLNQTILLGLLRQLVRGIYKTEIIKRHKISFAPKLMHTGTVFSLNYILHSRKAKYINHCVYYYLQRSDSISYNYNRKYFDGSVKICKMCLDLCKRFGKEIYFVWYFDWIADDLINCLFDCELEDHDIKNILSEIKWLCEYEGMKLNSEYSKMIVLMMKKNDIDSVFELFKNLREVRKYTLELENAKKWFLQQIKFKDDRIKELEDWTNELQMAKNWLSEQVDFKDARIKELEQK